MNVGESEEAIGKAHVLSSSVIVSDFGAFDRIEYDPFETLHSRVLFKKRQTLGLQRGLYS